MEYEAKSRVNTLFQTVTQMKSPGSSSCAVTTNQFCTQQQKELSKCLSTSLSGNTPSSPAVQNRYSSKDSKRPDVLNTSYPVHVLRPRLGREHGQNPRPAADVQHDFVLEGVLVVIHGVPVGERPHFVLQHFLVNHTTDRLRRRLTQISHAQVRKCDGLNFKQWLNMAVWICCDTCRGAVQIAHSLRPI